MSEQKYTERISGKLEISEEKINELQGIRLETIQNEKERQKNTRVCTHAHARVHTEEQTSVSDGTTYKKPNTWFGSLKERREGGREKNV